LITLIRRSSHAKEDFAMDIWGDIEGLAFVDNVKCRHGDLVGMILGFSGRDIQKGLHRDFCIEFLYRVLRKMMGNELLVCSRFRRRSKTLAGRTFQEGIGFRLGAVLSRIAFEGLSECLDEATPAVIAGRTSDLID